MVAVHYFGRMTVVYVHTAPEEVKPKTSICAGIASISLEKYWKTLVNDDLVVVGCNQRPIHRGGVPVSGTNLLGWRRWSLKACHS